MCAPCAVNSAESYKYWLQAWKKNNGLDLIVVSVGRKQGAMSAFGWSFGGLIPTWIKSRDLLAAMTRGKLGLAK